MNMSGDLEDLSNVLDPERKNMTYEQWLNSRDVFTDGHCSAIIKVLPDQSDLLVSHVTWNRLVLIVEYMSMIPILTNSFILFLLLNIFLL